MIELRWYIDKDDNKTLQWRKVVQPTRVGRNAWISDWNVVPEIREEDIAPAQAGNDG